MSEVDASWRSMCELIEVYFVEVKLECSSGYRHVENFMHDISHSNFSKFAMYSLLVLCMYSLM